MMKKFFVPSVTNIFIGILVIIFFLWVANMATHNELFIVAKSSNKGSEHRHEDKTKKSSTVSTVSTVSTGRQRGQLRPIIKTPYVSQYPIHIYGDNTLFNVTMANTCINKGYAPNTPEYDQCVGDILNQNIDNYII